MKPAYANRRVDTGSQAWVEYFRRAGLEFAPLGGAIDGVAWCGVRVQLIDFKANAKAPLTKTQLKLVERGCPIAFVYSESTARQVVTALKGEARSAWEQTTP